MAEKKKSSHCTEVQRKMLVGFLESDEELRTGKFSNTFTYKESQRRWETIAQKLNSVPGAKKEWASWRRTWQDLKKNVKKKSTALKKYSCGTGGGPSQKELTSDELSILNCIDKQTIEGISVIEESCIDMGVSDKVTIIDHDYHMGVQNEEHALKENLEASQQNIQEEIPTSRTSAKKRKMAGQRLSEAVKTSQNLTRVLENQNLNVENYNSKKLKLIERDVIAKERIASALEIISKSF